MKRLIILLMLLINLASLANRNNAIEVRVKTPDATFIAFIQANNLDSELSSKNKCITIWIHPHEFNLYSKELWVLESKIKDVYNRNTQNEWTGLYVLDGGEYVQLMFKDVKNYTVEEMFYSNQINL